MGNSERSLDGVDFNSVLRAATYGAGASLLGYLVYRLFLHSPRVENLTGRVVLITGASGGLGKALAHEFFRRGCVVVITGREIKRLVSARQDILSDCPDKSPDRIIAYEMDVGNIERLPASVEGLVDAVSSNMGDKKFALDILVNNAGISQRTDFLDTPISSHSKIFDVNYFGPVFLTKLLMSHLLESAHPTVVNICSLQSWISMPGRCAYSASKFALRAFGDSLRCEMGDRLRVLSVYPGYIATNIDANALKKGDEHATTEPVASHGGELSAEDAARRVLAGLQNAEETDLMLYNDMMQRAAVLLTYLRPQLLHRELFAKHQQETGRH